MVQGVFLYGLDKFTHYTGIPGFKLIQIFAL